MVMGGSTACNWSGIATGLWSMMLNTKYTARLQSVLNVQLSEAKAVLQLTQLLVAEPMAADVMCIMAMQAQSKEAFLQPPILQLLVDYMTDCGTGSPGVALLGLLAGIHSCLLSDIHSYSLEAHLCVLLYHSIETSSAERTNALLRSISLFCLSACMPSN